MKLSENFTLDELIKSQEAIRLGIANEPQDEHITNLILLCKNILQPIRNHFKMNSKLVGVINYESLRQGKSSSNIASYVKKRETRRNEFIWKIPKSTLIVWDESQKLKNPKTKNSETCLAALKQGYKMLFCSATNATNPLELKTVGMSIGLFENNKQYYDYDVLKFHLQIWDVR